MTRKKSVFLVAFLVPMLAIAALGIKTTFLKAESGRSADAFVGANVLASGGDVSLETVKEKIRQKNAKWTAEETSVSRLNPSEKAQRVAAGSLKLTTPETPIVEPPVQAAAPQLDWRNNNGNFVTPVKDQGSCGSCWAFATTATAESTRLIAGHTPYAQNPLDLSEQVMLSCSGAGTCNGGYPGEASQFIVSTGLPAEACYAYSGTNGNCASACQNWQAAATKIAGYVGIPQDVASLKNALASYGPISTVFNVYSDFYYYKSGVYSYTSGSFVGGHAVSIVGYDDLTQSFLVKNSWGTGWGEAGYFRIAYSELNGMTSFGSSNLAYNALAVSDNVPPAVSVASPLSGSSVRATVSISAKATDNVSVAGMEAYIDGVKVASSYASTLAYSWNTKKYTVGSHNITIMARDGSGNTGSKSITVYVRR